jgi:hypothetical protein
MLADTPDAATPITFEAEAEKPTRAPSRRKAPTRDAPAEAATEEPIDEPSEESEELEAVAEPEDAAVAAADSPEATEQPKKKRTRRGTRGGRGRKKPAITTAIGPAADEVAPDADGRKTPKIHVPSPELAAEPEPGVEHVAEEPEQSVDGRVDVDPADDQPKRKRSRRGTRGGRKRKKPAANGGTPEEAELAEVAVAVAEESPPEYVPMSEWIEDFDSRAPRPR